MGGGGNPDYHDMRSLPPITYHFQPVQPIQIAAALVGKVASDAVAVVVAPTM